MINSEPSALVLDTTTMHPARRYNYWLGGKDNFAPDRESGDAIAKIFPSIANAARENYYFAGRAVRALAADHGVDQFLDIGTGLPTSDHIHHVAQRITPAARIVYVDNDPLVLVHARALLTSTREGRVTYLHADLRRPHDILHADELTSTLDMSRPVGLLLAAVLHFLPDEDAYSSVRVLLDALAPGSFLVLSHASYDLLTADTRIALTSKDYPGKAGFTTRTREQIAGFFADLDMLEPGLTVVSRWRPEPTGRQLEDDEVGVFGGVAVKAGQSS
jgi:trans-aconitate methyltransferase